MDHNNNCHFLSELLLCNVTLFSSLLVVLQWIWSRIRSLWLLFFSGSLRFFSVQHYFLSPLSTVSRFSRVWGGC